MKVLVLGVIYVPGHGMGPFNRPIEIEDPSVIKMLKRFPKVKIIGGDDMAGFYSGSVFPITIKAPVKKEAEKPVVVEEVIEEPIIEEVVPEEPVVEEVVVEEPVVEEVAEEIVEEEPVAEEVAPSEEELKKLTVAELKAILDEMGIEYVSKDTKATLISKILNK